VRRAEGRCDPPVSKGEVAAKDLPQGAIPQQGRRCVGEGPAWDPWTPAWIAWCYGSCGRFSKRFLKVCGSTSDGTRLRCITRTKVRVALSHYICAGIYVPEGYKVPEGCARAQRVLRLDRSDKRELTNLSSGFGGGRAAPPFAIDVGEGVGIGLAVFRGEPSPFRRQSCGRPRSNSRKKASPGAPRRAGYRYRSRALQDVAQRWLSASRPLESQNYSHGRGRERKIGVAISHFC
jgi:hypothetical protein